MMKTTILSGLALLTIAMLAAPARAGDLNPPGAPAPTMKSLDDIPGSWHRILPAAERFKLVMGDAAVLDRETGLVWEQQPESATGTNHNFADSVIVCIAYRRTGDRSGWRLPTIHELRSLFIGLPAGHPFTVGISEVFWSSTEDPSTPSSALVVSSQDVLIHPKTDTHRHWCVRGPGR